MADQPNERKLLPGQVFEELSDLSQPLQLKKLNDDLRLLYMLLGYGRTASGSWYSGGVAGSGVEVNGDDIIMTVKNIFLAAQDQHGDAHFVLSEEASAMGALNVLGELRVAGRRLVLPPGEWYMTVSADAPYTYGNPVEQGRAPGEADAYRSLYAALRDVPRILMGNLTVIVESQTGDADYEPMIIEGIAGEGTLRVIPGEASARIRAAALYVANCSADVAVLRIDVLGNAVGKIWWVDRYERRSAYSELSPVTVSNAALTMSACQIAGMPSGAVNALAGASIHAISCVTRGGSDAYYAEANARIAVDTCTGDGHTYSARAVRGGIISGTVNAPRATRPWRPAAPEVSIPSPSVGQVPTPPNQSGLPSPDAAYTWAVGQMTQYVNSYLVSSINTALASLASNAGWAVVNGIAAAREGFAEGLILGAPAQNAAGAAAVPESAALTVTALFAVDSATYAGAWLAHVNDDHTVTAVSDLQQGMAANGLMAYGVAWFQSIAIPENVTSVRLTITRAPHRGLPGPTPIHITGYLAPDREQAPKRVEDYGVVGRFSWGETRTVALPVQVADDLRSGKINALGVFSGEEHAAAILGLPPYLPRLEFWAY